MNPSATPEQPPTAGDVAVVLIQHWATMITDLEERAARAAEQARIAQHQVHVLQRERTRLRGEILSMQTIDAANRQHLENLSRFTVNALFWLPDIDNDHFLVREYNSIISDYNRDNYVDLTAETESDSE